MKISVTNPIFTTDYIIITCSSKSIFEETTDFKQLTLMFIYYLQ